MTVSAFIGLGSNLGESLQTLESACDQLNALVQVTVVEHSPWYGSKAVGPGSQPDYVNGVAQISTSLSAQQLLLALQDIEQAHGRERTEKWGARTLDLDLLWYDNQKINEPNLKVPHPRICERNFVLFPFNDLAPSINIAGQGTVAELTEQLNTKPIEKDGIWRL